jgi:TonB family protein
MGKKISLALLALSINVVCFGQGIYPVSEFHDPYNEKPRLPQYECGDEALNKFIENDLKFPDNLRPSQPQVTWLTFTVTTKGVIKNIRVDKTSGTALDNEAIKTLKKTKGKWTPGLQYGRYADMETTVYFKFKSW